MTLKIEHCRIGTEIICINNSFTHQSKTPLDYYYDWLKIGNVYTIRNLIQSKNPRKLGEPALLLEEIRGRVPQDFEAKEYAFNLWRFKLLDPKEIQIFYDLIAKTEDKKIFEPA